MTKKRLIEDIKINPARFYRVPADVARDRRFTDEERLQILEAWERDERALSVASDEGMGGGEPTRLREVVDARTEIEKRVPSHHAMSEPTKFGGQVSD